MQETYEQRKTLITLGAYVREYYIGDELARELIRQSDALRVLDAAMRRDPAWLEECADERCVIARQEQEGTP